MGLVGQGTRDMMCMDRIIVWEDFPRLYSDAAVRNL